MVRPNEFVDVRSLAVVSHQNGSSQAIERTGFLNANETLEFTLRVIQIRGGRCLVSVNDGPEKRVRMKRRSLDEVVNRLLKEEANARGLKLKN